jgi:hypothetical protein
MAHPAILCELGLLVRAMVVMVLGLAARGGGYPIPQAVEARDPARDAVALGRTHDDTLLDSFNRGYNLSVSGSIDSAEIITEFRRAVLIVREHAAQGEYAFGPHDLEPALAPYRGLVSFIVQVRLNPMHTFAKPPAYDLYIRTGPQSKPLAAHPFTRDPIYPPGMIPGGAFVGVRLEGSFVSADVAAASEPFLVVTTETGQTLWQARIDLSRYR